MRSARDDRVQDEGREHHRGPAALHEAGHRRAGLGDARHLGQGGVRAGEQHEAQLADHAVERSVGQVQLVGVHRAELDGRGALLRRVRRGDGQHLGREVGREEASLFPEAAGRGARGDAGSAGDLERPPALAQVGEDQELLGDGAEEGGGELVVAGRGLAPRRARLVGVNGGIEFGHRGNYSLSRG